MRQIGDPDHVLVRFRRQAEHEVELHAVPASGKRRSAGLQYFFLGDVFIDGVAQALRSGLRRKGKAALAHLLHLEHQLPREIVRAERRKRNIDLARLAVIQQLIRQLRQILIVGGRKARHRDLAAAGILQRLHSLLIEHVRVLAAHGPVAEASLTEAAAADAASEHLQIGAVMDDLRRGDDLLLRPVGPVHVLHDALGHALRRAVQRCDRRKCAVLVIGMFIERRDINALDSGNGPQEFRLAPARLFGRLIARNDLDRALLTLSEREKVDEIRQRLRIHGADAARKNDVFQAGALTCQQRHARKLKHIEDVRVAHLVAQRERDHVEAAHGVLAFQCVKRDGIFAHRLLHIAPRSEHALTPDARHLVHNAVEDAHSNIGHADLIGIREAERDPDVHVRLFLDDLIVFAADIARGLLHPRQDAV